MFAIMLHVNLRYSPHLVNHYHTEQLAKMMVLDYMLQLMPFGELQGKEYFLM